MQFELPLGEGAYNPYSDHRMRIKVAIGTY